MTIRLLPARIPPEEALKRFQRKRWRNLFGLRMPKPARVNDRGEPASLELVWIPVHAFRFALSHAGKQIQSWVSVDASYGGFALFGRAESLMEDAPQEEVFPALLEREEAEELAREGVVRYILRKRGAKPSVDSVTDHLVFHTPVWVYYFRTARGKVNLAVLDAYTGDPMGGQVRRTIVGGLIRKRKEAALAQASCEA